MYMHKFGTKPECSIQIHENIDIINTSFLDYYTVY